MFSVNLAQKIESESSVPSQDRRHKSHAPPSQNRTRRTSFNKNNVSKAITGTTTSNNNIKNLQVSTRFEASTAGDTGPSSGIMLIETSQSPKPRGKQMSLKELAAYTAKLNMKKFQKGVAKMM